MGIKIRKALISDFSRLYNLGKNIPELRVSLNEPFMDKDDFKGRIKDKKHIFLLASDGKNIIGFIVANAKDADNPIKKRYACLVYIAVDSKHRNKGVATLLYKECIKRLKARKITNVYAWADMKSGVIKFLRKKGFDIGKPSVWMDREI